MWTWLPWLWLTACGTSEREVRAPVPVPGTGRFAGADDADAQPAPAEAPDDRCDPCVLLLEHDYRELEGGLACALCGLGPCDTFPDPDGDPCDRADELRNCIYARLGYTFDTAPEWRARFDTEPWYRPDPDFSWDRVTRVQRRNAEHLRDLAESRACR